MAERGINRVTLIGNLGQNPEIRYTPNGGPVASLSLATSESWRDRQTGEMRENTEWHRVVLFGKLAEIAGEYLRKGTQVYIEGQLRTRNWKDDSGITRYVTEIVVGQNGTMQMLGGRRDSEHAPQGRQPSGERPSAPQQSAPSSPADDKKGKGRGGKGRKTAETPAPQPPQGPFPPDDYSDDIPF